MPSGMLDLKDALRRLDPRRRSPGQKRKVGKKARRKIHPPLPVPLEHRHSAQRMGTGYWHKEENRAAILERKKHSEARADALRRARNRRRDAEDRRNRR